MVAILAVKMMIQKTSQKETRCRRYATMQKDRKRSAPLFFKYANKMPKNAHKMKKGPRRMFEYKEQIDSKRCPKTYRLL